ncbi:hypothetical protein AG0111_0g6960 [Alternaria gaisen]|uniref:Uncharacterized protein n=1 Tax=Alternaria gaisen TaxID=167740 RepID=A0ACB6FLK9_9PLEO|nr:hypothetical protein AG0111_0g6960 [Alternaria gaisen]
MLCFLLAVKRALLHFNGANAHNETNTSATCDSLFQNPEVSKTGFQYGFFSSAPDMTAAHNGNLATGRNCPNLPCGILICAKIKVASSRIDQRGPVLRMNGL